MTTKKKCFIYYLYASQKLFQQPGDLEGSGIITDTAI